MSLRLASDVRYRMLFDEAVLIRQEEAEVLGLNLVGARILDCVREGRSAEETVGVLEREFDADPDVLAADVAEFLDELVALGVLTREGAADGV